jgi:acyl dehydratase
MAAKRDTETTGRDWTAPSKTIPIQGYAGDLKWIRMDRMLKRATQTPSAQVHVP